MTSFSSYSEICHHWNSKKVELSLLFYFVGSKCGTVPSSGTVGRFVILLITNTISENLGRVEVHSHDGQRNLWRGWNVYALFAVNAPIIRMVSSCIVAVTVFWCSLTGGNWQKRKRVFLTCPCHEIYRDEEVGLKSCKNTWKNTIFVKMWNLGQYRENLIFC